MPIAQRLRSAWEAFRRGPAGYGAGVAWTGGPLYADAFGAKRGPSPTQLVESFKQIAFACTEFNALGVAALPLRLYAASGQGAPKPRSLAHPMAVPGQQKRRLMALPYVRRSFHLRDVEDVHEITNHALLDTLDRPAVDAVTGLSYFDRASWIATHVRYLDIVGITYVKPESFGGLGFPELVEAKAPPECLWPLQAQYVYPTRTTTTALIEYFRYFQESYRPAELMMIRLRPGLRDPYGSGYAAAQAAWQYSGLEDKEITMWDQLLGTGARPNAVLSPEDALTPLGDDERARVDREMNTWHSRGRAGRMAVFSIPMRLQPINYQGFDTGEMQQAVYNMERMCNCFGVPVSYMSSETNLANMQASRAFHAQFGIEPRAHCVAAALTDLARRYDSRLFFAFDAANPEDEEKRAKIIDMQVRNGQITWNQANADSPWPEFPEGDERFIPNNLATPEMLAQKHESGLKATEAKAAGSDRESGRPPAAKAKAQGGAAKSDDTTEAERRVLRRAERVLRKLEREIES